MKYLNLPVSLAHDQSLLKSTPEQVGIWFMLIAYCHEQMNGGNIQCCHDWPDQMWLRVAGCNAATIAQESPLWHMTPMVLVVHHYDTDSEEAYRKKQRLGRYYAEKQWQAKREKKIVQMPSSNSGKPQKDNAS